MNIVAFLVAFFATLLTAVVAALLVVSVFKLIGWVFRSLVDIVAPTLQLVAEKLVGEKMVNVVKVDIDAKQGPIAGKQYGKGERFTVFKSDYGYRIKKPKGPAKTKEQKS